MKLPNFLIVGAAKSGTTSLYEYLGQHPEVYTSPVKEPRFFAFEGEPPRFEGPGAEKNITAAVSDLADYAALFDGATNERSLGEASTVYLGSAKAAERIKHHVPDVRLVAILRDPVERALSAYRMGVRKGFETAPSFEAALEAEEERARGNWWFGRYRAGGLYTPHLERYVSMFGRDRLRVYLHDDLVADPSGLCKDLFGFLGVDPSFAPDLRKRHNAAPTPFRSKPLQLVASRSRRVVPSLPRALRRRVKDLSHRAEREANDSPMSPATRRELREFYRDDVRKLSALLDRDLSSWLDNGLSGTHQ